VKTEKSKNDSEERSGRLLKVKQNDRRLILGKLKTDGSQDKLKFRKIKQGQSPGIRRMLDAKRRFQFSKAK
jgi:hypothetical protein